MPPNLTHCPLNVQNSKQIYYYVSYYDNLFVDFNFPLASHIALPSRQTPKSFEPCTKSKENTDSVWHTLNETKQAHIIDHFD